MIDDLRMAGYDVDLRSAFQSRNCFPYGAG